MLDHLLPSCHHLPSFLSVLCLRTGQILYGQWIEESGRSICVCVCCAAVHCQSSDLLCNVEMVVVRVCVGWA